MEENVISQYGIPYQITISQEQDPRNQKHDPRVAVTGAHVEGITYIYEVSYIGRINHLGTYAMLKL